MDIVLEDVTFGYDDTIVLHGIDLKLSNSGLICIVGPNGVGKSTLVKCMNGLLKPRSGTVSINGRNIQGYELKDLAKFMGFVPASSSDAFPMSVIESVMIGRHAHQKWRTSNHDMEMVFKSLRVMGIEGLSERYTTELSAGQHQKVNLCRGLVQESSILILDEPTSNLDVRHQLFVTELLQAISMETGIMTIMISHDLNIAAKYADMVIVMNEPGRICCVGTPDEVITKEVIKRVYGVDCEVIRNGSRPHIMLKSVI